MRELCKNFMLQAYKPRLSLTTDCRENQQLLTHGDGCLCWIIRKLPLSSKIWFAFSFYLKQNLNLQNLHKDSLVHSGFISCFQSVRVVLLILRLVALFNQPTTPWSSHTFFAAPFSSFSLSNDKASNNQHNWEQA